MIGPSSARCHVAPPSTVTSTPSIGAHPDQVRLSSRQGCVRNERWREKKSGKPGGTSNDRVRHLTGPGVERPHRPIPVNAAAIATPNSALWTTLCSRMASRSPHPRLRQTAHRRGPLHPKDNALPQALRRLSTPTPNTSNRPGVDPDNQTGGRQESGADVD